MTVTREEFVDRIMREQERRMKPGRIMEQVIRSERARLLESDYNNYKYDVITKTIRSVRR